MESDRTHPLNVYGRTKLAGEKEVLGWVHGIVFRTAWLFSETGHNFVKTILAAARERAGTGEPLRVVDDQVGSPTYAGHLAAAVDEALQRGLGPGLYHLAGSGYCSWCELAREVVELAGLDVEVEPITTAEVGRPAPRPAFSALDTERPIPRLPHGRRASPRPSTGWSRSDERPRSCARWTRPSMTRESREGGDVRLVVTGGAGFIGSNFVRYMLDRYDDVEIVNLDKLTYAGNLENLRDVEDDPRYTFVQGDICDAAVVARALRGADAVVNFAAETHVDRSISGPQDFIRTDVLGTHTLLEAVRELDIPRYLQISTDEVYGSIETGAFTEESPLDPSSPYSASKAGADLLVLAYHATFGTPVLITRSSNNYGAWQYPEKIVPLFITNAIDDLQLPVYGDGLNVRDWLYVDDNCAGIDLVLREGVPGQVYNIGGGNEVHQHHATRDPRAARQGRGAHPLRHRPAGPRPPLRHRLLQAQGSGLAPQVAFDAGLARTVDWYRTHEDWWRPIKSGEWREYYARQYQGLS